MQFPWSVLHRGVPAPGRWLCHRLLQHAGVSAHTAQFLSAGLRFLLCAGGGGAGASGSGSCGQPYTLHSGCQWGASLEDGADIREILHGGEELRGHAAAQVPMLWGQKLH